jgi:hypothetical protein
VFAVLLQELGSIIGTLALLQEETDPTANPEPIGILRFFLGAILILAIYVGAWLFTYWISKDE